MLAHQDKDRWGDLKLCDSVLLNNLKHIFVDECRHNVDRDVEFGRHEHSIQLAVGMIQREEADPALISSWIFTSSFELGFLGIFEKDGLFCVRYQVVMGLATLVRRSSKVRIETPTIMTPLGRPVVPLE